MVTRLNGARPGNILLLNAAFDQVTEVVSRFGKFGVSAKRVATIATGRIADFCLC